MYHIIFKDMAPDVTSTLLPCEEVQDAQGVTCEGRPLSTHVNVDGQSIGKLLDLLKHPVNGIRQRARVELSEHPSDKVLAATDKWIAQFDPKAKEDAHHFLEALWVYQRNDTRNDVLLMQVLNSPVEHARISAKTVKQFWDKNL